MKGYTGLDKLNHTDKTVAKMIPIGRQHPMAVPDIADTLNISVRSVREGIHRLIVVYGLPICGTRKNGTGVYYPRTIAEREEGLAPLREQSKKTWQRIKVVERADLSHALSEVCKLKNGGAKHD